MYGCALKLNHNKTVRLDTGRIREYVCAQLLDLCASEDLEVQGNSLSALVRIMFNLLFLV